MSPAVAKLLWLLLEVLVAVFLYVKCLLRDYLQHYLTFPLSQGHHLIGCLTTFYYHYTTQHNHSDCSIYITVSSSSCFTLLVLMTQFLFTNTYAIY